jgi:hypothetical protein
MRHSQLPFTLTGSLGETEESACRQSRDAEVAARALELRELGKTHLEVCEGLNALGFRTPTGKLWRHPQQIIKLLQSFG